MRFKTLLIAALIVSLGGMAFAELQNVELGGSIRIRGNYFNMDSLRDSSYVEQRTRLNVKADFTQDVSAFIEFDSYGFWGEGFRSNYLTGADARGNSDVALYQAYIEARNLWGTPLSLRVGRQEIALGSQMLVGTNDYSYNFSGLSFDALRLTFANDYVNIDAIAAKLAETVSDFGDDDVDMYAVYGSYIGIEDVTLDAYWVFIRDDQGALANILRNDTTVDIHTLGLRGAGVISGFDFDVEAAYQFGDVAADVEYAEWAVNAEVGYTFDMTLQPRVFARFAYFGGGDPDTSCWSNDADLPFNRLFSNNQYSQFLDYFNRNMSNFLAYTLGVSAMPTEAIELKLVGSFYESDQRAGNSGRSLGWEVGLFADYNYSEDLVIRGGYSHFFGRKGLSGDVIVNNGLFGWPGEKKDDYDYVFIETELAF
ncbi:MAG TPA: porin [Candidatus Hydrogenedentes bacterium]|nr:porin [Candidatus Hydrogenedentota bacterium]